MTATTRSTEVSLQIRNIVTFADAMGSDLVTVARALDQSRLRLQRDNFKTPSRVLAALGEMQANGDKPKRKHRS